MPQQGQARRKELAIASLLVAPTLPGAATAAGVSLSTLRRWLKDEEFQKRYREAKNELVGFATGRLKGAMGKAVAVLEGVAEAKDNPPAARVAASRAILELGLYSHEAEEMTAKIEELERRVQEDGARK